MKRSACIKIATCSLVVALFSSQYGVCAEKGPAAPAVPAAPAAPAGQAAQKAPSAPEAKTDQAKTPETTISLKAPLFNPSFGTFPLAKINDDQITIDEFISNMDALHKAVAGQEAAAHKKSYAELLDRLISVKLMVQEARRMELDQQSTVQMFLKANRHLFLKVALFAQLTKDVKPDEKEVQQTLAKLRREVKLRQLTFGDEKAAEKFVKEVRSGKKSFDELAAGAIANGEAVGGKTDTFMHVDTISENYQKVLANMKVGDSSSVVKLPLNFIVFKLIEDKKSDDPKLKDQARALALAAAKNRALESAKEALYKKYLVRNNKLIKHLDLEAPKPGLEKLLKDKRVLVKVTGEKPITVADLVKSVRWGLTHGLDRAIQEKKANKLLQPALTDMMSAIVIRKEALARGLDKTSHYKEQVKQDEEQTLFGAFIEIAMKPQIKLEQKDLEGYYEAHKNEFMLPETLQLAALAFTTKASAEKALEKLRKGIDMKWLAQNADDLAPADSEGLLDFGNQMASLASLPEPLQKVVADAKTGDSRLYDSPEGVHYVIYVAQVNPARQQTLVEAAKELVPATYNDKFKKLMDDWNKKLRSAADVTIYADF